MRLRHLFVLLTILLLAAGLGWLASGPTQPRRAPDIAFTILEGGPLRLEALRGQPVLINFWSTSCAACVEELPHLARLHRELAPRGLQIIGVAMPYDPPNRVVEMRHRKALPYPIALDIRGEAVRAFGDVRLTPTTFLVGPEGRILYRETGKLDVEGVRAQAVKLLGDAGLARSLRAGG
ncbi:MAG: TlpA disulfide reductase family protein [Gammaproteobacteria bacterium]|jgi:peroxiredoxin